MNAVRHREFISSAELNFLSKPPNPFENTTSTPAIAAPVLSPALGRLKRMPIATIPDFKINRAKPVNALRPMPAAA
jgi:hypothetical protein